MLHTFGHPITTCCDMLGVENRKIAHARALWVCHFLVARVDPSLSSYFGKGPFVPY